MSLNLCSFELPTKKRKLEPYILLPSFSPRGSPSTSTLRPAKKPRSWSTVHTSSSGSPSQPRSPLSTKQANGVTLNGSPKSRRRNLSQTSSASSIRSQRQSGASQSKTNVKTPPPRPRPPSFQGAPLDGLNDRPRPLAVHSPWKQRLGSPLLETRESSPDEMLLGNGQFTSPSTFRTHKLNLNGSEAHNSLSLRSRTVSEEREVLSNLHFDGNGLPPSSSMASGSESASASASPMKGGNFLAKEEPDEGEEEPPSPPGHVCLSSDALQRNQRIGKADKSAIAQALESSQRRNGRESGEVAHSCASYWTMTPAQSYVAMLEQMYGPGDIHRGHGRRPQRVRHLQSKSQANQAKSCSARSQSL